MPRVSATQSHLGNHRRKSRARRCARDLAHDRGGFRAGRDAESGPADHRCIRRDLFQEHAAACEVARQNAMRGVEQPFDIVVTTNSGYPLDQNLYQAVKGMSAAAKIVKKDGTIIALPSAATAFPIMERTVRSSLLSHRLARSLDMITAPDYFAGRSMASPDSGHDSIEGQRTRQGRSPDRRSNPICTSRSNSRRFGSSSRLPVGAASRGATVCVLPNGPQTIPYCKL